MIPNHHILPWLATITWPWHSFLRVFFKIASIGLTQNFHILTHQNITIYLILSKRRSRKKLFCYCYCYADFLRQISVLSVSATVRKLSVIMWIHGKKNHNKKTLGRLKKCVWCDFFFFTEGWTWRKLRNFSMTAMKIEVNTSNVQPFFNICEHFFWQTD